MTKSGEGNGTPLQYSCLENPWTEEPGRLQFMGSLRVEQTERLHCHFLLSCIGAAIGGYSLIALLRLLIAEASLVEEQGL